MRMARSFGILDINYIVTRNCVTSQNGFVGRASLHLNLRSPWKIWCSHSNVNIVTMAGDFNDPRKDITLIPGLAERTDGARARSEVW